MTPISADATTCDSGWTLRRWSWRWDVTVFVAAVAAIPSARIVFDASVRRFPGSTLVVAAFVTVGSVIALAASMSRMVGSAGSHLRHVFCSRYLFECGLVLSAAALWLAGTCLRDDPFRQVLSTGRVSPLDVVQAGAALATAACLAAAVAAFVGAWDELQSERHW
jgi:hypothetical protein